MTEETYEDECVARGAALLDGRLPGWRRRVRVDQLALRDWFACVLAQLYGSFYDGLRGLDLTLAAGGAVAELGFDVLSGDEARYPALQSAWERLLRDPAPRFGEVASGAPRSVRGLAGGDR